MRLFIGIAESLSFAEAARAQRISAAAASRAIAALEAEVRAPLLRRTTRAVALTQEGAFYLERVRAALAELDAAARALIGEDADPQGSLMVSAPVVFGRMHVLPVIDTLLARYRALDVRLVLTDRVVRLVDEGIDVAVRIADLADSALHAPKACFRKADQRPKDHLRTCQVLRRPMRCDSERAGDDLSSSMHGGAT